MAATIRHTEDKRVRLGFSTNGHTLCAVEIHWEVGRSYDMSESQRPEDHIVPDDVPSEIASAPSIAVEGQPGDLVATENTMLREQHNIFAEFHESYVSRYIQLADTKAAWSFAISASLLAFVVARADLQNMFASFSDNAISSVLLAATILLLIGSAFCSFAVIRPRLSTSGESLIYFGAVAKKQSSDHFVRDVAIKSASEIAELRLKHSFDISKICMQKYQNLVIAFNLGICGFIGLLILLSLQALN